MSLNNALQIGRSGLIAAQTGIQVAGNNMANAATKGYSRQVLNLAPIQGEPTGRGQRIGRGVDVVSITRQVDTALQSRLRDAISDEHAALLSEQYLSAIEQLQNELSDGDVSSMLNEFFNSFSELANTPDDHAVRSVVTQQGLHVASVVRELRHEYTVVRGGIDKDLGATVETVNGILNEIETLNKQIALSETGEAVANGLRDQRDVLIDDLARYMDVTAIEQPSGAVDVFVGSIPVVLNGESRGLELRSVSKGDDVEVTIRVSADQSELAVSSGRIGALLAQRESGVNEAIEDLDAMSEQLIFQLNRLHSQGQGQQGFELVTGASINRDPSENLNSSLNDLPFRVEHGSFEIHMTHSESGERTTYQINVNGDAMSLNDLIDEINNGVAVPSLTAGKTVSGEFTLSADPGHEISFSNDSSGALAALGVNTFFTGRNAVDMDVNETVLNDSSFLAAGQGHVAGSNGTALAIANLQEQPVEELENRSLREFWVESVNKFAVRTSSARSEVKSSELVRESLDAQVKAVSGVSIDEEAINLLAFQRQFQASARFIQVIDEALQTLIGLG